MLTYIYYGSIRGDLSLWMALFECLSFQYHQGTLVLPEYLFPANDWRGLISHIALCSREKKGQTGHGGAQFKVRLHIKDVKPPPHLGSSGQLQYL